MSLLSLIDGFNERLDVRSEDKADILDALCPLLTQMFQGRCFPIVAVPKRSQLTRSLANQCHSAPFAHPLSALVTDVDFSDP